MSYGLSGLGDSKLPQPFQHELNDTVMKADSIAELFINYYINVKI